MGTCALSALCIESLALIQNQAIASGMRNTDTVILARNRREVDHKDQRFLQGLIPTDKRENRTVRIVHIDPLKAVPVIVLTVQRRMCLIELKESPHKALHIAVRRFLEKLPVQRDLFIPLMPLCEFLAHEEQLLAGMTYHVTVAALQVRKLILVDARHLVDHGALEVHHLIVREYQDIVLARKIGETEGHLIVVVAPEVGIQLHVLEEVVHPAHVPLEGEAEPVFLGTVGDQRPSRALLRDDHAAVLTAGNHRV